MHHGIVLGDRLLGLCSQKQSHGALSTSLFPGLLRNFRMAPILPLFLVLGITSLFFSPGISTPSPAVMEMYYDIGYLKEYFTARRDEVHLYMRQLNVTYKNIFRPYVLALHDIHSNKLIRKFKVPAFNHGLQVLSIRGWSNRWIRDPTTNKGLRLTVYRGRRKKLAIVTPLIPFPENQYPYMILFGDDSDNKLLGWRFLSGYPLNSVSDIDTRRSRRQRRVTSSLTQSPQCVATQKSVKLKGQRINNEHIIVEPAHFKLTQCTQACRSLPPIGDHPQTKKLLAQTLTRVCCTPQHLQAVAFLVKEPSRQTVTFASVPNVAPSGCAWTAS